MSEVKTFKVDADDYPILIRTEINRRDDGYYKVTNIYRRKKSGFEYVTEYPKVSLKLDSTYTLFNMQPHYTMGFTLPGDKLNPFPPVSEVEVLSEENDKGEKVLFNLTVPNEEDE